MASLNSTEVAARNGFCNAQYHLGMHYMTTGDREKAKYWLNKASIQGHIFSKFNYGHLLMQEKRLDEALEVFLPLTSPPTHPEVFFTLFVIYKNNKNKEKSIEMLDQGCLNESADCFRERGRIAHLSGEKELAFHCFERGVELGDGYCCYHYSVFSGKVNIPILRKSAELGYWKASEHIGTLIMRGEMLGTWRDAQENFRVAYERAPDRKRALFLKWAINWLDHFGDGTPSDDGFIFMPMMCEFPETSLIEKTRMDRDSLGFGLAIAVVGYEIFLAAEEFVEESLYHLAHASIFGSGTPERDLIKAHEYVGRLIHLTGDPKLVEFIHEIREFLEDDPRNIKGLIRVYQTEGNFEKVEELKAKINQ